MKSFYLGLLALPIVFSSVTEAQAFENVEDAIAAKARQALESISATPMDENVAASVREQIAQGLDLMERPQTIAGGKKYTFLACVHGSLGMETIRGAASVDAFACYDWSRNKLYLIGGGSITPMSIHPDFRFHKGYAGGGGLAVFRHPDGQSISGPYVCGGASFAAGWGGKAVLCKGEDKSFGYGGAQYGAIAQIGAGSGLYVEEASKVIKGIGERIHHSIRKNTEGAACLPADSERGETCDEKPADQATATTAS